MKTKIAINDCFGGFSLSKEAVLLGRKLSGDPKWAGCVLNGEAYEDGSLNTLSNRYGCHLDCDFPRHDPVLVEVIETLGKKASGHCAELVVEEIDGNKYRVREYDGNESVETPDSIVWVQA